MFFHLLKHSDKFERMINLGSGAIYDNKNYKPKMKEDYFWVREELINKFGKYNKDDFGLPNDLYS